VVDGPRLVGTGIGSAPITGVARVAENAEEAFDRLVPGEILVTRTTSPAYNMVLTLVGGLVTAEGGPMSHAAVLSRELGIPAVVGAPDAMRLIADGDLVEVDPVAGRVQVVGGGHPAG
jgi:pyruvate,water dikinase